MKLRLKDLGGIEYMKMLRLKESSHEMVIHGTLFSNEVNKLRVLKICSIQQVPELRPAYVLQ